jgi:hypothetical protein
MLSERQVESLSQRTGVELLKKTAMTETIEMTKMKKVTTTALMRVMKIN